MNTLATLAAWWVLAGCFSVLFLILAFLDIDRDLPSEGQVFLIGLLGPLSLPFTVPLCAYRLIRFAGRLARDGVRDTAQALRPHMTRKSDPGLVEAEREVERYLKEAS